MGKDFVSIGLDIGSSMTKVVYSFGTGEGTERKIDKRRKVIKFDRFYNEEKEASDDGKYSYWMLPTLFENGNIKEGNTYDLDTAVFGIKNNFEKANNCEGRIPYVRFISCLMHYLENDAPELKDVKKEKKFYYTLGCPNVYNEDLNRFRKALAQAFLLKDIVDFKEWNKKFEDIDNDDKLRESINEKFKIDEINDEVACIKSAYENKDKNVIDAIKKSLGKKENDKLNDEDVKNFIKTLPFQLPENLQVLPEILGEAFTVKYNLKLSNKGGNLHYFIYDAGNSTFDQGALIEVSVFDDYDRKDDGMISDDGKVLSVVSDEMVIYEELAEKYGIDGLKSEEKFIRNKFKINKIKKFFDNKKNKEKFNDVLKAVVEEANENGKSSLQLTEMLNKDEFKKKLEEIFNNVKNIDFVLKAVDEVAKKISTVELTEIKLMLSEDEFKKKLEEFFDNKKNKEKINDVFKAVDNVAEKLGISALQLTKEDKELIESETSKANSKKIEKFFENEENAKKFEVVLDDVWAKARRLMHLNPWDQALVGMYGGRMTSPLLKKLKILGKKAVDIPNEFTFEGNAKDSDWFEKETGYSRFFVAVGLTCGILGNSMFITNYFDKENK